MTTFHVTPTAGDREPFTIVADRAEFDKVSGRCNFYRTVDDMGAPPAGRKEILVASELNVSFREAPPAEPEA